jgi:hypothetical protein
MLPAERPSFGPEFLSPSLRRSNRRVPTFELKFLVNEEQARRVEAWIAPRLTLDAHADPRLGNAYRISSVYLDTDDLAVFHRAPLYARRKFRLRRYGDGPGVFLERKTKWGARLVKRRTPIAPADLGRLLDGKYDPTWAGRWFQRHILARRLRPTCHLCYDRVAYVGYDDGPVRLTIDRRVIAAPHGEWGLQVAERGRTLLEGEAILELKFTGLLPVLFRRLVYELALAPNTVSKYRRAVETWGWHQVRGARGLCLNG